jgi:hypothetical protein
MSVNDNSSDAMHVRMNESHRMVTHSLSIRSGSRTIRMIEGWHDPDRSLLINY